MKKTFLFVLAISLSKISFSQSWSEMMQEPGRNFYEIQNAFNEYWKDKDITIKGRGFKPFKRWEYFVGPRVYPTGDLSLITTTWANFQSFTRENSGNKTYNTQSVNTWTAMGPNGPLSGSVNGLLAKTGRDNFITFDPSNSSTYWCGTPSGGLWNTTNNGSTWSTLTDYLTVIGCSDLSIDPTNTNIMYLATGDGEGNGDTYSIGVLKSTDGGLTWNTTGLTFTPSQQKQMRRVLVNPLNPQIVFAIGNFGVYRSINGGTNWTLIQAGNFYDIKFKSGNPHVVFIAGAVLMRSVNSGASFTQITSTSGVPGGANRMNIAVTPADTNYVYVLASKSSNSGLLAVIRSVNGGSTFSTMCTSPDILTNACNPGTTVGGQGWYDLSCAASPLNKDEFVVGGVNVWKSTNGGANFSMIGCWNSVTPSPPFVHADQHELEYNSSGTLYVTNDGGISELLSTGVWQDHTAPRNISQIYKIGLSSLTPNLWITGHQDNGTNIYNNGIYSASYGGDGMDCFIDRTNDNTLFGSLYNGGFRRSTNGGANWGNITNGLTGNADWVSPFKQDPGNAQTLYAGYSQMFVSTDLGLSWNQLTNTGGSGYIVEFAIAPSNNQVIYVIHGTSLRKTIDGGVTWTNITTGVPVGSAAPRFITVDPTDPNTAWVVLSGYSAGNKIFQTNNGGSTWTNVSYNLPNLPGNCSVYQPGTNDRLYVGMDVGVYTRDNSTNSWTLFNTSLPNVPVHDMEISPAAPTLLRAGTYGRGVYEVNVILATVPPTSGIGVPTQICPGATKMFMDNSSEDPTSWSWSVSPSTGVVLNASTLQNPLITFPSPGIYTLSLTASNGFGTGSTATQTISVNAAPALSLTVSGGSETVCVGENIILSAAGAATYTWFPNVTAGSTLTFVATVNDAITYTVNAKGANGCAGTETLSLLVSDCTGILKTKSQNDQFSVFPNPANQRITISNLSDSPVEASLELEDASGKILLKQNLSFKKDRTELQINISHLSNGVYILKVKPEKGNTYFTKIVKE